MYTATKEQMDSLFGEGTSYYKLGITPEKIGKNRNRDVIYCLQKTSANPEIGDMAVEWQDVLDKFAVHIAKLVEQNQALQTKVDELEDKLRQQGSWLASKELQDSMRTRLKSVEEKIFGKSHSW